MCRTVLPTCVYFVHAWYLKQQEAATVSPGAKATVMCVTTWVLGTELRSCAGAVYACTHWLSSPT